MGVRTKLGLSWDQVGTKLGPSRTKLGPFIVCSTLTMLYKSLMLRNNSQPIAHNDEPFLCAQRDKVENRKIDR